MIVQTGLFCRNDQYFSGVLSQFMSFTAVMLIFCWCSALSGAGQTGAGKKRGIDERESVTVRPRQGFFRYCW